jgi:hypothetical protein
MSRGAELLQGDVLRQLQPDERPGEDLGYLRWRRMER